MAHRPRVPWSHRRTLRHRCARCQGSLFGLQRHVSHHRRRALRGRGRIDAYGCVAVDSEASTGHTRLLLKGSDAADAARSRIEFISEQHHGGDALRRHRKDVGQETRRISLETAHPTQLRLGHGRSLYAHRHTTEPHHQRTLRRADGCGHEHTGHHHSWTVLSGRRHPVRHRPTPFAARPQAIRERIRTDRASSPWNCVCQPTTPI